MVAGFAGHVSWFSRTLVAGTKLVSAAKETYDRKMTLRYGEPVFLVLPTRVQGQSQHHQSRLSCRFGVAGT